MVQLVPMMDSAVARKISRAHNVSIVRMVTLVSLPVNLVDAMMMVAYTIIVTRQPVIAYVFPKLKEIFVIDARLTILTFRPVNFVTAMQEEARVVNVWLELVIVTVLSMSLGKNVTNVFLDILIFRIAKIVNVPPLEP